MKVLPSSRQIHYFAVLAEEGHFGRAAERLGLAQPALTQQIQRLEELLDCTLLHRRPRVELTAAGEHFLAGSQRILADLESAVEAARRAGRGETGTLSLGLVASTLLLPSITDALREFATTHPAVRLEVAAMDTSEQLEALRRGRIELGLMRDPPSETFLRAETLLRERFVIAIPPSHRLARRRGVTLSSLKEEPFILFQRSVNPRLHDQITALCRAAGFEPRVVQEVRDVQSRLGMVAAGLGVTITAASLRRTQPAITFKTIVKPDAWTMVVVGSIADRPLSPPAAAFSRTLLGEPGRKAG
jgi:DNA-binding transcriptional LysR family regulator